MTEQDSPTVAAAVVGMHTRHTVAIAEGEPEADPATDSTESGLGSETETATETAIDSPTDDSIASGTGIDAHADRDAGADRARVDADADRARVDADADADVDPDMGTAADSGAGAGTGAGRRTGRSAQLEREGEVAADFLERLLDIADLDGDIDVDVDGDRAAVAIVDSDEGRVPRRLVGQEGKVLDALQELTRLAVQAATGERSRLMLDIAGHRAERRAALVLVARGAIEKVRSSGEKQSLAAMTAFERKVVHDEVVAAGLSSESEGNDPHRHVVILPG